jgi:nitrogen fixation NifU-like protein
MSEQKKVDDFERWVTALQEAILERERAMYSAKVLAEAREPRNMGFMDQADACGLVIGPCGDTMEIFVRLEGGQIKQVTFMTDGCGPTVACGSMLTRMMEGRSLAEAAALQPADLIAALDGLPDEHLHCATLAVNTLHEAIANFHPKDGDRSE